MTKNDLRKPQIALLRAEKHLVAGAAAIAAATGVAKADQALDGAASAAQAELETAFVALAEKTSQLHSLLEAKATAVGGKLLAQGVPKDPAVEAVKSVLMLG